jgi:magnesium chelatase family protein
MLGKVLTAGLLGVDAKLVEVETHSTSGLPYFEIVGLPDQAVKESKVRVKSALSNSGFRWGNQRAVVNLSPADLRKEGGGFDLPIALSILSAQKIIKADLLNKFLFAGELGLDGSLKPSPGALIFALLAKDKGLEGIIVPASNAREASVVSGMKVYSAANLAQVVEFLNGEKELPRIESPVHQLFQKGAESELDLSEVRGQESAKRALEVAAAGGHNLLMIGPPGSGKTMLSQRLPGILPALALTESLEVTRVYSILGLLTNDLPLITSRPFRAPHHTISDAGIVGGGTYPRPGEISLAHNGVLFLDELPEFRKNVLEALRQPMEAGVVLISRAVGSITFPSRFMMVAAMNP